MSIRFKVADVLPDAYKPLQDFEKYLDNAGLDKIQRELIKIRTSQINGCAFCLNKHIKDSLKYGEDPKRIYVLSAWREAKQWFSEEEQAILALTEEVTLIASQGVSDKVFNRSLALFGEVKTVQFILAIIAMNAWNRMAITFHLHP